MIIGRKTHPKTTPFQRGLCKVGPQARSASSIEAQRSPSSMLLCPFHVNSATVESRSTAMNTTITLSILTVPTPKLINFLNYILGKLKNKQHHSKVQLSNEWSHFGVLPIESKVRKICISQGFTLGVRVYKKNERYP